MKHIFDNYERRAILWILLGSLVPLLVKGQNIVPSKEIVLYPGDSAAIYGKMAQTFDGGKATIWYNGTSNKIRFCFLGNCYTMGDTASVNIYNSDGTLTGNRAVSGSGTSNLSLGTTGSKLNQFNLNTDNDWSLLLDNGTQQNLLAAIGSDMEWSLTQGSVLNAMYLSQTQWAMTSTDGVSNTVNFQISYLDNGNYIQGFSPTFPGLRFIGDTTNFVSTSYVTKAWVENKINTLETITGGPYADRYMNILIYTANHTLTAIDGNTAAIHMRSVSPLDVIIPSEAMEALPDGFIVTIFADSAAVTIDDANVTIEPVGADLTLDEDQYGVLIKRHDNTWDWLGPQSAVGGIDGHVIEDEGTPLTQRANMNFTGAGVSVADSGGKTVVTIAGGGGITNGAGNNVYPYSDGTNLLGGGLSRDANDALTLAVSDAGTNTQLQSWNITRTTSNTPATGIGIRNSYTVETSASNNELGAAMDIVTTDVGAGTEDFDFVFNLMQNGAAVGEKFRIRSNGSLSYGSTANSPTVTVTYPTSGGFAVNRYVSTATNVFDVGAESLGQYGGTPNNVSGANLIWFDDQASAYRMGLNASGEFYVGVSNTNYGLGVTQAGVVTVGRKTTGPGIFRIGEDADNGSNTVGFTVAASLAGNTDYTLPSAFPSVNDSRLLSSTTGTMTWAPTTLNTETTQVGNVTTGEDQLFSYTIPAGTLAANGNSLRFRFSGSRAANGNTKTIQLAFGATDIVNWAGTGTATWSIDCLLIRTGATTQKCNCAVVTATGGESHTSVTAPAETLSGAINLILTGEATATNDIVKESAKVTFEP